MTWLAGSLPPKWETLPFLAPGFGLNQPHGLPIQVPAALLHIQLPANGLEDSPCAWAPAPKWEACLPTGPAPAIWGVKQRMKDPSLSLLLSVTQPFKQNLFLKKIQSTYMHTCLCVCMYHKNVKPKAAVNRMEHKLNRIWRLKTSRKSCLDGPQPSTALGIFSGHVCQGCECRTSTD